MIKWENIPQNKEIISLFKELKIIRTQKIHSKSCMLSMFSTIWHWNTHKLKSVWIYWRCMMYIITKPTSYNIAAKMYAAVILQAHRRKFVVPHKWLQHSLQNRLTKIFLSSDESKPANFSLPTRFFLANTDACYNAIYLKSFGEYLKKIKSNFEQWIRFENIT